MCSQSILVSFCELLIQNAPSFLFFERIWFCFAPWFVTVQIVVVRAFKFWKILSRQLLLGGSSVSGCEFYLQGSIVHLSRLLISNRFYNSGLSLPYALWLWAHGSCGFNLTQLLKYKDLVSSTVDLGSGVHHGNHVMDVKLSQSSPVSGDFTLSAQTSSSIFLCA